MAYIELVGRVQSLSGAVHRVFRPTRNPSAFRSFAEDGCADQPAAESLGVELMHDVGPRSEHLDYSAPRSFAGAFMLCHYDIANAAHQWPLRMAGRSDTNAAMFTNRHSG
jgi:hypothetical protein